MRIARARIELPIGVLLKVFEQPEDCVQEANEILDRVVGVSPGSAHAAWRERDGS